MGSDVFPAWVTTAQAAAYFGVSPRTIRNLMDRGELPSIKIGASRRIAVADLVAYERHLSASAAS